MIFVSTKQKPILGVFLSSIFAVISVLFLSFTASANETDNTDKTTANANESLIFDELVVSDTTSIDSPDEIEELIAPLILVGNTVGEITVNVRADMSVASVEAQEFLIAIKEYLKPNIYQKISSQQHNFILTENLPDGVSILLNEELNIEIELTPEVMKNIHPKVFKNQPKFRKKIDKPIFSTINDINLNFNSTLEEKIDLGVSTAIRFNRSLLTGFSSYQQGKTEIFNRNLLYNYEDTDKNYWLGYQYSPIFAGVNAEKLLGVSVGNTHIVDHIVLESDGRYLDLVQAANVKTYINDILYSDKDFPAGRHAIDVPVNINPSLITLKVKDIYGREKSIDFDFSGRFSNQIPSEGQLLYFANLGKNDDDEVKLYAGAEFALDELSKVELAANLSSDSQVLGVTHYQLFSPMSLRNTLNISKQEKTGMSFKSNVFFQELDTNIALDWQKDYVINQELQEDRLEFLLDTNIIPISLLSLNLNMKYQKYKDILTQGVSAKYQWNKDLSTELSYEKGGDMQFSLDWTPLSDTDTWVRTYGKNHTVGANHYLLPERSIAAQQTDNAGSLQRLYSFEDDTTLFRHRISLQEGDNTKQVITASTQFSVVSSDDKINLAPIVGDGGFVMFDARGEFENSIGASYQDKNCALYQASTCVLLVPSETLLRPNYQFDDISFDLAISGIDKELWVPFKGGISQIIDVSKVYFVEGSVLSNNKVVDLLIGEVADENGNVKDIFTDEEGIFFAQLKVGVYQLKFPGFQSQEIVIKESDNKDSVIDLGRVSIHKD
ncbi:MAG: hypothetical protein E3I13_04015 [Gammaproteobacteria bacterium]|nr:MAG: hypothetical protein E3I13_04015 [Gammaproteobacteria bacterium]